MNTAPCDRDKGHLWHQPARLQPVQAQPVALTPVAPLRWAEIRWSLANIISFLYQIPNALNSASGQHCPRPSLPSLSQLCFVLSGLCFCCLHDYRPVGLLLDSFLSSPSHTHALTHTLNSAINRPLRPVVWGSLCPFQTILPADTRYIHWLQLVIIGDFLGAQSCPPSPKKSHTSLPALHATYLCFKSFIPFSFLFFYSSFVALLLPDSLSAEALASSKAYRFCGNGCQAATHVHLHQSAHWYYAGPPSVRQPPARAGRLGHLPSQTS